MKLDAVPVTLGCALCAVAMLGSGCANHHGSGRAVESASTAWSCPKDRIAIVSETVPGQAAPPADVAGDPARLAIWKKSLPDPDFHRVFVLSGCGNTGSFQCSYQDYTDFGARGEATIEGDWFCSPAMEITILSRTTLNGAAPAAPTGGYGLGVIGPVVAVVRAASLAEKAGLALADVIIDVDHQTVGTGPDAGSRIIALLNEGSASSHSLRVRRGDATVDLTILAPPK